MKTFRNLSTVLITICCSTAVIMGLLTVQGSASPTLINVNAAVFSISLVALAASVVMYFNTKNNLIAMLKRRAARVYEDLLHYKMKVIDAIDGEDCFYRVNCALYDDTSFSRTKKFLDEEFFLLLAFEPLFDSKVAVVSMRNFANLHTELTYILRSYTNDKKEFQKFEACYSKVYGTPLKRGVKEDKFMHEDLAEDYEAILSGYEYTMYNIDKLLTFIDKHLTTLDTFYKVGPKWSETKNILNTEFHNWLAHKPS